jgi:hypothetical protein
MTVQNRNFAFLILSVIGFLVILGTGIYVTTRGQDAEVPALNPTTEQSDTSSTPVTDSQTANELYITNLQFLASTFSETEYLYINSEVLNFGQQNYLDTFGYVIDETSFTQQSDASYGFMIRDTNDKKLFYVVASRTSDSQISLTFYKI